MGRSINSDSIGRRDFLRQSGVIAGVGSISWMGVLREAVGRSRAQGKPLLTETAFNSYVVSVRKQGPVATQNFVTALRGNLRAALRDRFTLTTVQDASVGSLSTTDASIIRSAIDKGFLGSNEFRIKLPTTVTSYGCQWQAQRTTKLLDSGASAEVWTVVASDRTP